MVILLNVFVHLSEFVEGISGKGVSKSEGSLGGY